MSKEALTCPECGSEQEEPTNVCVDCGLELTPEEEPEGADESSINSSGTEEGTDSD